MTDAEKAGAGFVGVMGILAVHAVLSLLRSATITFFWRWYAVPVFHLPVLSLWEVYGCALLVNVVAAPGVFAKDTLPFGPAMFRSLMWLAMAWALAGILNLLK